MGQHSDTTINLSKIESHKANHWTNHKHKNTPVWFDNWENDLVELGLAVRDPMSGKVTIIEDQLRNILNFDETCLSLDGSTFSWGGCPPKSFEDSSLPHTGKAMTKTLKHQP